MTDGASALMNPVGTDAFPVIFDSGASLAISGHKGDFVGDIVPTRTLKLGGMAHGMPIEGIGVGKWCFTIGRTSITVHTQCYYVPNAKARLISPQRLFRKTAGIHGQFICTEDHATLSFAGSPDLVIEYNTRSHLPISYGHNATATVPQLNLGLPDESNQNLTPSQKLLLHWHHRFGHRNFPAVQRLLRVMPFGSEKFISASRCDLPRCEVCEFAKAHRSSTGGKKTRPHPLSDGALKVNHLRAGEAVSVDHFESRLRGRTYTSFGKTTSDQYVGGCIFVDHMSGYIHIENQLGFSSSETIRAKQNFEQLALDNGVIVTNYMADNGLFKANQFVSHLREHNQRVQYCGVNAHHQNGIAERSIRTVSEMARAMLLHASIRWKTGIDSSLWPMAVNYAAHVYNSSPNDQGIAPGDLFTGTQLPRHKLRDIHVFGCPTYVLDPTLQQGKKLPRWQPRSRRGVFVGLSPHHSSDVPLILNLSTGSISPQFHVVFDDSFSTVMSVTSEEEPPSFWNDLCLESDSVHRIPLETDASVHLPDDWLTPDELEEKRRAIARLDKIRPTYWYKKPSSSLPDSSTTPPPVTPVRNPVAPPPPASAPIAPPSMLEICNNAKDVSTNQAYCDSISLLSFQSRELRNSGCQHRH